VAAKTAKLEAEKKTRRKRKTSPPLVVEMLVIPTPLSREAKSDEEEDDDEATDDPPVVEEHSVVEERTVRRLLSPTAKRQQELGQKVTEDGLCQGLEVQRAAAATQARMPVPIKVHTFRSKLRVAATARYSCKTEGLLVDYLLMFTLSRCFLQVDCGAPS
jgi:hypothetical protein